MTTDLSFILFSLLWVCSAQASASIQVCVPYFHFTGAQRLVWRKIIDVSALSSSFGGVPTLQTPLVNLIGARLPWQLAITRYSNICSTHTHAHTHTHTHTHTTCNNFSKSPLSMVLCFSDGNLLAVLREGGLEIRWVTFFPHNPGPCASCLIAHCLLVVCFVVLASWDNCYRQGLKDLEAGGISNWWPAFRFEPTWLPPSYCPDEPSCYSAHLIKQLCSSGWTHVFDHIRAMRYCFELFVHRCRGEDFEVVTAHCKGVWLKD